MTLDLLQTGVNNINVIVLLLLLLLLIYNKIADLKVLHATATCLINCDYVLVQ